MNRYIINLFLNFYLFIYHILLNFIVSVGSLCDIMVKVLNCKIIVCDFELQTLLLHSLLD